MCQEGAAVAEAAVAEEGKEEEEEPCKNVAEGTAKVIAEERRRLQGQQITKGAVQRMYQDDTTPGYIICAAPHLVLTCFTRAVVQVLDIQQLSSGRSAGIDKVQRFR